jgi:low affinity Fe/Cu permease
VTDATLPHAQAAPAFQSFARRCEQVVAHPAASVGALLFVGLWLVAGPFYGWSSNWQLIINTSSSVVTLVMVFLIRTQRRHGRSS